MQFSVSNDTLWAVLKVNKDCNELKLNLISLKGRHEEINGPLE